MIVSFEVLIHPSWLVAITTCVQDISFNIKTSWAALLVKRDNTNYEGRLK